MSNLFKALLEVQKQIEPVKKTADNLFFHSKYANLEAVVDAVIPVLSKNGVVCVQTTDINPTTGAPFLKTALIHAESGERVESLMPIISKDSSDPQKVIAGLTYMRRASLTTICGLATQDDDGNTASGNSKGKDEKKKYKVPQPLSKPKTEEKKSEPTETGAKKKITPTSVVVDTSAPLYKYKVKTEKDGDFLTEKEVVAKIAKANIGKSVAIRMTVDNEFRNILIDILDAVPF